MKKGIVIIAAFCLAWVGFSERALAGPVPVSTQEGAQLNALAAHDALLTLKAGGSFPNAPTVLEAREETALRKLSAGSPNLGDLKAGDGPGEVLTWVVVICVCLILLKLVNVF
jgi:hypothetical protein